MIVKRTKTLDSTLTKVKNSKEIVNKYYHLGNDQNYYTFTINEHSIKHINHFIKRSLIFIKNAKKTK